jgi:hypothetical protein
MFSLEELFCSVDDFCQQFEPMWQQQFVGNGLAHRHRRRSFCLSEIIRSVSIGQQSRVEYGHKKRELIGQLYRQGHLYTQEGGVEVFDHDWKTSAKDVAIPHGLYDLFLNVGYVQIGTSHDTSEFACEAIRQWWNDYGCHHDSNGRFDSPAL